MENNPHQTINERHIVDPVPHDSEEFRSVPHPSEDFRTIPNSAERFGSVRNDSETFRTERKQSHTTTVRDAARMFEDAGVARTERSIVNWCRPDVRGMARLDAYFDPNERRYYITRQSIESAIAEEKAKAFRNVPQPSAPFGFVPNPSASAVHEKVFHGSDLKWDDEKVQKLRQEILDLRILNGGKDVAIKILTEQGKEMLKQLNEGNKKIGELETRLLQVEAPFERKLRVRSSESETGQEFGI